jgi:hypothetical protein
VRRLAVGLPQHPDEHCPQRPILLAVDQQLGECARLRVPPELADPVGSVEVGEHQDVELLGAGSGPEGVEALGTLQRCSIVRDGLLAYPMTQ